MHFRFFSYARFDLYYSKPVACESQLTPQFPELPSPLVGGERDVSWHEPLIDGASATHIEAFVVTRNFILYCVR